MLTVYRFHRGNRIDGYEYVGELTKLFVWVDEGNKSKRLIIKHTSALLFGTPTNVINWIMA